MTELYTDADQPLTTQTSTLSPNGNGYTFSEVYDQTLGVLTGLSSTTNTTISDLATVSYTVNALLGSLNFNTSAGVGSSLATENFSYDGDLRPTEESATWQSGSGQSGTFYDEARGYDPASNVDTVTTTISKPNGQSGSYSETQNFCYNEQNQLVWAGNSGTQPAPGNGTCGGGTLANNFPNASYATSFSYTNLGQLWQGPLNGTGSSEQYLYCNSQPHQVSDIVPAGQGYTCSNLPSSIPYAVKYDAWGNVTSRSYNNQTATLSYNKLDEMVEWQVPNTNQVWYAYDANGDRTLERSTVGSTTTETVYAFGLEEYSYDSSGTLTSSTHYYSLAGHLIGEVQGSSTNVFLTDALGSVQAVISNTQNSAALLFNQVFAPYGTPLSHNGNQISQYTNKGFTGQYNDPTSGLDYYVSRYYDSVSGVFLSADTVAGNPFGMNPYGYAGSNPETFNDPTGQAYIPPGNGSGGTGGNGNNNGNGNSGGGSGSGSGGGGGCGWWNAWCWFGGNGGNSGSGSSGNGTSHLPLNLMDSSPYGLGGEASEIQGPQGLTGSLDSQMAEADAQLTEEGDLLTLEAEVPQLVDDPGDALQAQALTEETVEAFKGDVGQEDAAQDVKEYGEHTNSTDTTTDTNTTTTSTSYSNRFPGRLSGETDDAKNAGVKTLKIGDPELGQAIQSAPDGEFNFKWAVSTDNELGIIQHSVGDLEIHHSVIFDGADVLSAGEGVFTLDEAGNYVLEYLDNNSGHYFSGDLASWDAAFNTIGIPAFQNAGVIFQEDFSF